LFDKETQLLVAKKCASLLSPLPGSIIFGSHVGSSSGSGPNVGLSKNGTGAMFYRHSPDSWKNMWEKEVFDSVPAGIQVEAGILIRPVTGEDILWWIVTRL